MPYFETSQEWLKQSTLLFQAYPTSTRVTTKYKIHTPPSPDARKKRKRAEPAAETQPSETAPAAPKATLTLKTFDPDSGVCLKYRTDKAAEVGRLIASLGRLGKHMAALPDADALGEADKALEAPVAADGADAVETPAAAEGDAKTAQQAKGAGGAQGSGGGGGKKKKKGKK